MKLRLKKGVYVQNLVYKVLNEPNFIPFDHLNSVENPRFIFLLSSSFLHELFKLEVEQVNLEWRSGVIPSFFIIFFKVTSKCLKSFTKLSGLTRWLGLLFNPIAHGNSIFGIVHGVRLKEGLNWRFPFQIEPAGVFVN